LFRERIRAPAFAVDRDKIGLAVFHPWRYAVLQALTVNASHHTKCS